MASGLNFVFGLPGADNKGWLVLLIALITGAATLSVVAGLDGGVKRLSQLNIYLALAFMVFVLVVGPTLFILSLFSQTVGTYTQNFLGSAFYTENARAGEPAGLADELDDLLLGVVDLVVAVRGDVHRRISKGRTVRELLVGVIAFPTLLCFVWMTVFGGTALNLQLEGTRDIAGAVANDLSTALFEMLQPLPLTTVASLLGVALIISFFITSSDSGSLVVDHLTSGGSSIHPNPSGVFWAIMEGTIAAVLLFSEGGLGALQAGAVSTGLPFALVLLFMIWSLYKAFDRELDLLEGHYDLAQYQERHQELIDLNVAEAEALADDGGDGSVEAAVVETTVGESSSAESTAESDGEPSG